MGKLKFRWILILLSTLCMAQKQNDIVELEQYFNARYSADFLRTTDNVMFVMPPGTRGRIQETKLFNSGNQGLFVELTSGPKKGEMVWVYYKTPPQEPGMKLFTSENELTETQNIEEAKALETTQETIGIMAPKPQQPVTRQQAKNLVEIVKKGQTAVTEGLSATRPCDNCQTQAITTAGHERTIRRETPKPETKKMPPSSKDATQKEVVRPPAESVVFSPASSQDSPLRKAIERTENHATSRGLVSKWQKGEYYLGVRTSTGQAERISFSNNGPNSVVKSKRIGWSREWGFDYFDLARQDLGFSVFDSIDGSSKRSKESRFMVFPRETLPTIRIEGNRQIVTLPNGETVTYNAQTKEIIGGVLKEKSLTSGSHPQVSYQGKGVVIKANNEGPDHPFHGRGSATISKQGKSCSVPKKELWPDQRESSTFRFKYFSDKDFDTYLKKRCGFSLY